MTRGVTRTIPAWYVNSGWVRLGYAHTHASVQGMTVGKAGVRRGTAHAVVTAGMTRNELYPTMTRAADGTHAYVVLGGEGDPHDVTTPAAIAPDTAVEVLVTIIGNRRRRPLRHHRTTRSRRPVPGGWARPPTPTPTPSSSPPKPFSDPQRLAQIAADAETALPGITDTPAWETLRGHLVVLAADGVDPIAALTAAAAARELDTARDISAVLDYRLDPTGNHSQAAAHCPGSPPSPPAVAELPDLARPISTPGPS